MVQQQTILAKFGEFALRSSDLDAILTEACRVVGQTLGTHLAAVMELQQGGQVLLMRAGVGWKPNTVGRTTLSAIDATSESHALRTGEPTISPDISRETRFVYAPFLTANGVKAVVNVIIIGAQERPPFGILQVDSRVVREFTVDDTAFLRSYANLLAAAVDRKKAENDLEATVVIRTRELAESSILRDDANRANQIKSEFLANMSHEIRTPMNGVLGMTDLLLRTDLDEAQRKYANVVRQSAETLIKLINNVLDISKLESSNVELEAIDFRISDLVEHVLILFTALAEHKQINFSAGVDETARQVLKGDPARLRQVLQNLVSNAIKFTDRGAVKLTISGREIGRDQVALRVDVRDSGCGFNETVRDKLFQAFQQADGSISRRYGGSGLGLAICKQTVALMGGQIGAESEPGKGSLFWVEVTLPRGEEQGVAAKAVGNPLLGVRALVLDDNEMDREIFKRHLAAHGMSVTTADNAQTGLLRLNEAVSSGMPFDVVVTDHNMPHTTGIEFAQAVQHRLAGATPPIVLVSSLVTPQASDPERASFRACLAKPVTGSDLIATLVRVLSFPHRKNPTVSPPTVESARILFVDDNETNRMLGVTLLEEAGYTVETAEDGIAAVEAARSGIFAAIFMDIRMPKMDGIEATQAIRCLPDSTGELPIIGLSANAMVGDRETSLHAGMNDYLSKPLDAHRFLLAAAKWTHSTIATVDQTVMPDKPTGERDTMPLLDEVVLGRLREMIPKPKFRSMIESYLAMDFVARIVERSSARDFAALDNLAHDCKGTSANLGASRLQMIAERLEVACRATDAPEVSRLIKELRHVTELTHAALRTFA